jgi:3-hydroxyacyl-CoA dehydrogenase
MGGVMNKIEKVAVLGAGIMGGQIAAHLANAGIPSLLFDISQDLADAGLEAVKKVKPAAFYSPRYADLITPCTYDKHMERLSEADWIIEAIIERLDIKKELFRNILSHIKPQAILSSNTSGLSLKEMSSEMPADLKKRFLITHFFNPPRYMHLLELIVSDETSPEILKTAVYAGENVLGKGIVYAKDTPNFVANRIGVYGMMLSLKLSQDLHLTVEEVDRLTGPVIGHPKSATFRTADLVGLDTLAHVAQTAYDKAPQDESREMFKIPPILEKLVQNKWLGEKTKKGFYHKAGKEILSLDFETMEYVPQKKVRFDGLRVAKRESTTAGKIRALAWSDDSAGKFVWELLSNTLIYSANRIPEITDNLVNIDNAMKWGFGWELGPFETWEALGLDRSLERMLAEGKTVPAWVTEMVNAAHHSFYRMEKQNLAYFDKTTLKFESIKENPKVTRLDILKNSSKELRRNWNASIIDLEDGVALVEFHSIVQAKMNPMDGAMLDMVSEAVDYLPANGYKAMVIGHQGQHFSAGANLALVLKYAEEKNWRMLEQLSRTFQEVNQKVHYAPIPTVAAPFNICLGGGFELSGACDRRVASAELYCGLVETGVGIIPAAGGNLRLLINNWIAMGPARPGPFPIVQKTFETIAFARVSTSAKEAVFLGFLRKDDKVIINPDHLIYEAKQEALQLVNGYRPPQSETELILPGEGGRLAIEQVVESYVKSGNISAHDALIAKKLAYVLTGGDRASTGQPVDEQYLLDIEREAFVSLCAEPLSRQRMAHMLKTGKPLRN